MAPRLTNSEMNQVLALFGDLSSRFANMESALHSLLEVLVDPCCPIVGAIVLDGMSFRGKIVKLGPLGSFRALPNESLAEEMRSIAKQLECIRPKRNQFVHGEWEFNPDFVRVGRIRCLVRKVKFSTNASGMDWDPHQLQEWTAKELRNLSKEVGELAYRMLKLREKFSQPHVAGGG